MAQALLAAGQRFPKRDGPLEGSDEVLEVVRGYECILTHVSLRTWGTPTMIHHGGHRAQKCRSLHFAPFGRFGRVTIRI